jgi:CheY-like chemotaxis protein
MAFQLHAFYFPTTVVCVDDNLGFLANLGLQLDPQLAFCRFASSAEALREVNARGQLSQLARQYFSRWHDNEFFGLHHHVIGLDLDKIHREVHNEHRFDEISVVVVDYAMPNLDGLEFCRRIRNRAIKKILFTGIADEKTAVRAFNDGVIDRFIAKNDSAATSELNRTIEELRHAYFRDVCSMVSTALAVGSHSYLDDPAFHRVFEEVQHERRAVEYYLCSDPEGFLLLDADGTPTLLLVRSEQDLQTHYQVAFDQGAPAPLLDALKSGQWVPHFWESDGFYRAECENWQKYMYPAKELHGRTWYSYAVVHDPPNFHLEHIISYNEFVGRFDREGRFTRARNPRLRIL